MRLNKNIPQNSALAHFNFPSHPLCFETVWQVSHFTSVVVLMDFGVLHQSFVQRISCNLFCAWISTRTLPLASWLEEASFHSDWFHASVVQMEIDTGNHLFLGNQIIHHWQVKRWSRRLWGKKKNAALWDHFQHNLRMVFTCCVQWLRGESDIYLCIYQIFIFALKYLSNLKTAFSFPARMGQFVANMNFPWHLCVNWFVTQWFSS